jgi:glycine oxidase
MEEPGALSGLCLASRALFPELASELEERTGISIEMISHGLLKFAATEEEEARLKKRMAWQKSTGQSAEWLTPDEVRRLEPEVADGMRGALYLPRDIQVSAPRLTLALARAAALTGGRIVEECRVLDFGIGKGRVTEVITTAGRVEGDVFILATGVWSGWMAQRFGLALPIVPIKGETLALRPARPLFVHTLFSEDVYLVPKANGEVIVGATEKAHETDCRVSAAAVHRLLGSAIQLVPALAEAEMSRCRAGIRPASADGLPFIGRVPGTDNLIVATGHGRNGILLSPITGRMVARLLRGEKEESWAPFLLNRLANNEKGESV